MVVATVYDRMTRTVTKAFRNETAFRYETPPT